MGENTKYDSFLDELISLEKQVLMLVQKNNNLSKEKMDLEKSISEIKRENEVLKLKLEELSSKISGKEVNTSFSFITTNTEEREILKDKLDDLITRIDKHISS